MALRDALSRVPRTAAALAVAASLAMPTAARAQAQPLFWTVDVEAGQHFPREPRVVHDQDDDDEDGRADGRQTTAIPAEDLAQLRFLPSRPAGEIRLEARGGLRLVVEGEPAGGELRVQADQPLPRVQGTATSKERGDSRLDIAWTGGRVSLPVTVVGLGFLDADSRPLRPSHDALALSRRVTHDGSLPRDPDTSERSPDPENFRVWVRDAALGSDSARVSLESVDRTTDAVRHLLRHVRVQGAAGQPLRSPFLRLVGDRTDLSAPEVGGRLLEVRLRDRVRVRYQVGRTELFQDVAVGRRGPPDDPRTALRGKLRLRALRLEEDGKPVIGRSDLDAVGLLQEQVEVANEIWLQCGIDFGPPSQADAAVVDPPPPGLLAIADGDGLPAAGDGLIRLRAGQRRVPPVRTRAGDTPAQTALRVAEALRRRGFVPSVTTNPKTDFGAGPSADITVRDRRGRPVALAPWPGQPVGSDATQRVDIGEVDLRDGIQQFDNMTASAGTLEERTLVKLIADDDPTTVDILVINGFVSADRQGEAFIEGDGGSIVNTLILDRNGIRYQRQAWVQAHELGHVLLDAPYHPDNIGPDRPWLLMDADARQGRVTGPKRITAEECERVRERSGPNATPALLSPLPR